MSKFLYHGSYTADGLAGIRKEGGKPRIKVVEELAASAGGRVESFYWAFGKDDFFITVDLPSNAAAAALALTVGASGAVNVTTTVLLTAEEVDQAAHTSVTYRKPGG